MLIELWERLRGYDKWIQTEARLTSSKVEKSSRVVKGSRQDFWFSTNTIVWTARQGEIQSADFYLADISLLKHFAVGETVTIRYDPMKPSKLYLRKLVLLNLCSGIKWTALVLAGIGVVVLVERFR